ncbi:MAG: hypothetical protein IT332_02995 [Ardenticatenales bacterium]|nr:hypothetical protein [Ardenticatenales bacterium]
MLDPREQAYVNAEPNPVHREAMRCALVTYRQPDTLAPGDAVPALRLARLGSGRRVRLDAPRRRPLVLIFGSYT